MNTKWLIPILLIGMVLLSSCSLITDLFKDDNYTPQNTSQTHNTTTNTSQTNTPKNNKFEIDTDYTNVILLDTKEGESTLIYTADGYLVLIDSGADPAKVLAELRDLGVAKLSYMVSTNPEREYSSGLDIIALKHHPTLIYQSGLKSPYVDAYSRISNTSNVLSETLLPSYDPLLLIPPYSSGFSEDNNLNSIMVELRDNILLMGGCNEGCEGVIKGLTFKLLSIPRVCPSVSFSYLVQSNVSTIIFPGKGPICDELLDEMSTLGLTYYDMEQTGDIQIIFKEDEPEINFQKR